MPADPSLTVRRIPIVTLLMVGAAVAVALFPACAPWLIYDRSAILSGEVWRMFTGQWVHFSLRHLVYDLVPLGIAGWILETRGAPRFGWFCALAPWVISAALLVFEPQMQFCGGLSGLGTATIVLLALSGLSGLAPQRWACGAALLIVVAKTIFELSTGRTVLATLDGLPVVASVTSHIAGAVFALVFFTTVIRRPKSAPSIHSHSSDALASPHLAPKIF